MLAPVISGEDAVRRHMALEVIGWIGLAIIVCSLPFQIYVLCARLLSARKNRHAGSRSNMR